MSTLTHAGTPKLGFQAEFDALIQGNQLPIQIANPDTLLPARPKMAELMPLDELESSSKIGLFQTYSKCMTTLQQMRSDLKRLLVNAVRTNTTWIDDGQRQQRHLSEQELVANFESSAFSIAADFGGQAKAEIAALPMPKIKETLLKSIVDGTTNLLRRANLEMMRLVKNEQLGTIEWHSDDVARYTFHRNQINDATVSSQSATRRDGRRETTTTTKDRVRRFRHSTITHDVIEAKDNPLPARGVGRPAAVEKLINETPNWLQGMMSIVTGFQIAEERRDREAVVDRWQEQSEEIRELPPVRVERMGFDPALVLGPYVLVGWDDTNVL